MADKQSQEEALKGNVIQSLKQWGGMHSRTSQMAHTQAHTHEDDRILSSSYGHSNPRDGATFSTLSDVADAVPPRLPFLLMDEHQWVRD